MHAVRTLWEGDRPARVGADLSAPGAGVWDVKWVEVRDAAGKWNLWASNVSGVSIAVKPSASGVWGPVVDLAGAPVATPAGCVVGASEPPLAGIPATGDGAGGAGQSSGAGAGSSTGVGGVAHPVDTPRTPGGCSAGCGPRTSLGLVGSALALLRKLTP